MRTGIIYKAISPSEKVYIGKTINRFSGRKQKHLLDAFNINKKLYNTHFSRAIRKHGRENFKWNILYDNIPEFYLNAMEITVIGWYDTYKNGYNSTLGGEGRSGCMHSKEIKKEISDASKKQWKENRDKMMATRIRGENHGNSKLTLNKVKEIRSKYIPYKYSCYKLAKEYNVSGETICNIVNNKIWKDDKYYPAVIKESMTGENHPQSKLSWVLINEIRNKYASGKHNRKELSENFNITLSVICNIINNKAWKDNNYIPPIKEPQTGENGPGSKLNWKSVAEIRDRLASGCSRKKLAKEFDIGISAIGRIANNKSWKE